ncbi:MAG: polysaccharide biosynthesis tyrosine autokinase [Propionibacteriaceae bacterium]|nr:polysaccharide biosynthesis tyrosine autokinase [Propionibacteriaceae bacterium]
MEFKEYVRILRQQWLVVVAMMCVVISGAAVMTLMQTPRYTASTELFFRVAGGESVSDVAQGGYFSTAQLESYARVAKSRLVMDPVADRLGYPGGGEALMADTTTEAPPQLVVMVISVTNPDPVMAARAANAVGEATIARVEELSNDSRSPVRVKASPLATAEVPAKPSEPNAMRNLLAAAAAGLLLGWGAAFIRTLADNKVRSTEDVKRISDGLPTLGVISEGEGPQLEMLAAPSDPMAEAYRRVATNLRFVTVDSTHNSVLVTSSVQSEGKSTIASNLAIALADSGESVLLIDADLRRPTIASVFALEGAVGLTTVLGGQAEVEDVLQVSPVPQLTLLAAGTLPPNPSALVGSLRMEALLDWAERNYDVVVIDSPPLLPVTDAAVLAPKCGGVVLVVSAGEVTKAELAESIAALERVDTTASGYVLNRAKANLSARAYTYG